MATKYLDLAGLQRYDGLIKSYISDADALSIKFGKIEDGVLKLYKVAAPAAGATPDFSLTLPTQDLSGKADKVSGATTGNFAGLDSNGNLTDSGSKASDFAVAGHTHNDKADKVSGATDGNLAALDANGNLTDAGAALSTLETKAHAGTIPAGAVATDIVGYAAEVASDEADAAQSAAEANSAVTVSQNGLVVTIYQGGNTAEDVIGTINIPADMVVQSGAVETYDAQHLPEGVDEAGTYLVLTLANASGQKIYINVADLIDTYTAAQGATQVQLAVNGRVLSATIVAGGVGATELATDAVVTAKIADGNVTKAKLAQGVQDSLDAADTALQPGDFEVISNAEIDALFPSA